MKKELVDILFNRFEKEKEEIRKVLSTNINSIVLLAKGKKDNIKMIITYEESDNNE